MFHETVISRRLTYKNNDRETLARVEESWIKIAIDWLSEIDAPLAAF
jgi:hypothetical protein